MKKTRKTLAVLLATILLLTGLPVSSLAAQSEYNYYVKEDGTAELTGYSGSETELVLPSVLDGYTITSIRSEFLYGRGNIVKVSIPDSITYIGYGAFNGTGLTTVEIPGSVKSIVGDAFAHCQELTSVIIHEGVEMLGWAAFSNCPKLETIALPDSILYISDSFANTGYGNNPDNWENDVLYIGSYLIDAKETLSSSYRVKEGTKAIASQAFANCTQLQEVILADSVVSLGGGAFSCCNSIKNIYLPRNVCSVYYLEDLDWTHAHAFANMEQLEYISVDPNNPYFYADENGVLYNKAEKSLIVYPPANQAKTYRIPDGTLKINEYAFSNSKNLEGLAFPLSLQMFAPNAFSGCDNVSHICYFGSDEQWATLLANSGLNIDDILITINEHMVPEWKLETAPTCIEEGVEAGVCEICGMEQSRSVPTVYHTLELVHGQSATCTAPGLEAGVICAVCGEILIAQEPIPALGHIDENGDGLCDRDGVALEPPEEEEDTGHTPWDEFRCSFCDTFEANQDTPFIGYIYEIIHFIVHRLQYVTQLFSI